MFHARPISPQALPHSLATILPIVDPGRLAPGDFDPLAGWRHTYSAWAGVRTGDKMPWHAGSLEIERSTGDAQTRLAVRQTKRLRKAGRQEVLQASAICCSDALSTPQSWQIESEMLDTDGKPINYTQTLTNGNQSPGFIFLTGSAEATIDVSGPCTSNWCLIDAVQRLPFEACRIDFDLLEDLELLKRGHRLETGQAAGFGGITLHSFHHIGPGILPTVYWLDDTHRLLMVIQGIGALIAEELCRPVDQVEAAK